MADDSSVEFTILDYVEGIKLPGDKFSKPANEYWALVSLREGLEFLYRQASQCNELVTRRLSPKVKVQVSGNDPLLAGVPRGLLTCAFHWYAISACQYVRTVGAIAHRQDNTRPKARQYTEEVIPKVLKFRNKVAAHFAWTLKDNRDSTADRLASVIPQLSFNDDSFYIGAWKVSLSEGRKTSFSEDIEAWSITEVHQRLRNRYWPENSKICAKGETST